MAKQAFGGSWTEVKLEKLAAYLQAYSKVMKMQRKHFQLWYVDAFAGTGFRSVKGAGDLLGAEMTVAAGSARLALEVDPPFDRYVFVEQNRRRYEELQRLADLRSDLADRMMFHHGDANKELVSLCSSINWRSSRAVVFLDPFGMQVEWTTLKALAATQAVDVWYLVPTGIALNRIMPRERQPGARWQARINRMLGEGFWEALYRFERKTDLFGELSEEARRDADLRHVGACVVERLQTLFPGVAKRGAIMRSRRSELYLLVFCCANPNPKAHKIALRIAEPILGKG